MYLYIYIDIYKYTLLNIYIYISKRSKKNGPTMCVVSSSILDLHRAGIQTHHDALHAQSSQISFSEPTMCLVTTSPTQ